MSTEHVEPVDTSPAASIVPSTATETEENNASERGNKTLQAQKWGWRDAIYLVILVLLVIAMAFRYTPNLTGDVAGEWWDPLLNIWTLSWNTTTLLHNPAHLWQAQLLYPNALTLSYSENLLGETLFYAPIFLLTHNPVLSYNLVFYLTFLLCGINMYLLARYFTGKPLAAFVAALIYAFAPYRLSEIDHIHVIAGEWIPLVFLFLDLSMKQRRWRHWSLCALFYLLQLLSSIYYGIFLSYTLLVYILIRYTLPFITGVRKQKGTFIKQLLRNALKPVVVLAAMLAFLILLMAPYLLSLSSGLARSIQQTAVFSAFVIDFRFTAPFNWLYGMNTFNGSALPYDSEHYLFLGLTTMALAAIGGILTFRKHDPAVRAFLWTGLVVLLFAFGPVLQFSTGSGAPLVPGPFHPNEVTTYPPSTPMPWLLTYYVLPGFKGLRVPARLIGVLLMILALLGAYAVAWLQEKRQRGQVLRNNTATAFPARAASPRTRMPFSLRTVVLNCLLLFLPIALLIEAVPAYLPVTHVPTGNAVPPVYTWLANHGGEEPIVELPMAHLDENFTSQDEAWYDYYAIYHSHPIMNGWSGQRPALTTQIAGVLLTFPSQDSLATLKKYHISYVVLHLGLYSPAIAPTLLAQVEASPGLQRLAVFGSDSVWQVR